MRQQIEKVIAELEQNRENALAKQKTTEDNFAFKYWGIEVGLDTAIDKLKKVLAEDKKVKKCMACNGSGYYDSHGSPPCGACDGTGVKA